MLTPPPAGSSRADALGWLCLVPQARRPIRRLPYTTAPPPRWLWCALSMKRLRCYHRLEEWYAKQSAALQVSLHSAQVCQVEGKRGQILLSVSAPSSLTLPLTLTLTLTLTPTLTLALTLTLTLTLSPTP